MKTAVALIALVGLGVTGCSGNDEPTAAPVSSAPTTFAVTGSIKVKAGPAQLFPDSPVVKAGEVGCRPSDGFDDIKTGTQVRVKDQSGKILAVGALGAGIWLQNDTYADFLSDCQFALYVEKIPEGQPFYQVEVGRRGAVTYTRADLRPSIVLNLQ